MLFSLLFACSDPVQVKGRIVDLWDQPVSNATIKMHGAEKSQTSSGNGEFSFVAKEGTMNFVVNKENYMPAIGAAEYKKGQENIDVVEFKLYPIPPENGFWGIGSKAYQQLKGFDIQEKKNALKNVQGLSDVGSVSLSTTKPIFVFKSTLREDQIQRLGLQLHQIEFLNKEKFTTITGEQETNVHLWQAKKEVSFDISAMETENHYLIEVSDPLSKGFYAFHTNDILTGNRNISTLTKEDLLAYPFQIK